MSWVRFSVIFSNFSAILPLPNLEGTESLDSYNELTDETLVLGWALGRCLKYLKHEVGIRGTNSVVVNDFGHQ
jgi:hypothetical protein